MSTKWGGPEREPGIVANKDEVLADASMLLSEAQDPEISTHVRINNITAVLGYMAYILDGSIEIDEGLEPEQMETILSEARGAAETLPSHATANEAGAVHSMTETLLTFTDQIKANMDAYYSGG